MCVGIQDFRLPSRWNPVAVYIRNLMYKYDFATLRHVRVLLKFIRISFIGAEEVENYIICRESARTAGMAAGRRMDIA